MAFELPVVDGADSVILTSSGIQYRGHLITFAEIEKFKANADDELEIVFKAPVVIGGEEMDGVVLEIEPSSAHQLFNLQTFVETALMQNGIAIMGRSNPDDPRTEGEVLQGIRTPDGSQAAVPTFDLRKIRKSAARAFTFGA